MSFSYISYKSFAFYLNSKIRHTGMTFITFMFFVCYDIYNFSNERFLKNETKKA